MRPDTPVKEDLIIEAATRRFAHFGFHKTTFSEIAKDLGVSQQSLYYYFPDKKALILKVALNIMTQLVEEMKQTLATKNTLVEKLKAIIEVKQSFFEKYFMLAAEKSSSDKLQDSDEFKALVQQMELDQLTIMINAFEQGVENNEIKSPDAAGAAQLLLKALTAMQDNYRTCHMIPDHASIHEMFEEQKALIEIYVMGLKNQLCNS